MSKRAKEDQHILEALDNESGIDDQLKNEIISEILDDKAIKQSLEKEQLLDEELSVDKELLFKLKGADKAAVETDLDEAHKEIDDVHDILKNEIKHRINIENQLIKEITRRKQIEIKLAQELARRVR